ncbi:MAG: hypothetical protein FWC79_08540 [Oscillospiraceae bacterium]|nr:hypothetical protein [Oscillospiraceae bacterium]
MKKQTKSNNKLNRSKKIPKLDVNIKKRLTICLGFTLILFIALTFRISWIQFAPTVAGVDLRTEAQRQQQEVISIAPRRGNLLDSSGRGIAFSSEIDIISVNPTRLRSSNRDDLSKEEVARAFSDIFLLDYWEVLYKLHSEEPSVDIVESNVHDQTVQFQDWIRENRVLGITITPQTIRFYPYNNLASNLVGFTRTDGHGAVGLEHSLDHLLAGTPRKSGNNH